jgi:hypothetical protein
MNSKKKLVSIVSPKGLASYPFLNNPSTKFKPEGEYSVKLVLNAEDGAKFVDQVKAVLRDAYKEQCALIKKDKLKMADFPWKETEDGKIEVKFGQTASYKSKQGDVYERKIALFDTKGNPVSDTIGSSSVLRCAADIYPWYAPSLGMGVSLKLKAVQVVELVAPSRILSADAYGFSAEEEGYVSGGESFPDDVFSESEDAPTTENVTSGEEF